ncbi:hypothetical protein [Cognatilysobacter segetis]|uniref:hypothetical protein n=1 Tax=Cognatilysobacter segetis TaxID=2492394 RepID=UPI00105DF401|nr:hypothetical protein [Lysobacter segetis]
MSMASFAPGWAFELIPEAHEKVRLGYEAENRRLRGSRFIAVVLRHEFDYDGLSEDILQLSGFAELEEAQRYADWLVERRISTEHLRPGREKWLLAGGRSGLHQALHQPSRRISDGTGFNSCYITVGVFAAGEHVPLDGGMLTAIDHSWELSRYFQYVAKAAASAEVASRV